MATTLTDHGDGKIQVRYSEATACIRILVGDEVSIRLRDRDEGHSLIDQLQDALRRQASHQGRTLLRAEDEVRAAAETRESL